MDLDILVRLKDIGYFCGMDYASKDIYNFALKISRFDHSLSTALITWRYTKDKKATIAALFHDIATPIFSHVIDYMNEDFLEQESTEVKTLDILSSSKKLEALLKEDNMVIEDLDFKKYSIVDNKRPKLCADRLDGIILTSLAWTKMLKTEDIKQILDSIEAYKNEDNELELGFKNKTTLLKILNLNEAIDIYCHSKEDTYMMLLLADITKYLLKYKIDYDDLYSLTETQAFEILNQLAISNFELKELLTKFSNLKKEDIPDISLPKIKKREIKPILKGKRYEILL